ncbi:BglG family transcription antiterminator LicT [Peribacillus sp. NPDC097895]|uniref:BglG family transcription antiterminator LicT n=1 Tax=Peribacillus sp. NPDC097895 TaxID=3390619 RepID=UPI003D0299CB
MRIKKIFNNNVLLAKNDNKEIVIMGKGIGYLKKTGDKVDMSIVDKTFILETNGLSEKLAQLVSEIPAGYLEISNEIIQYAKHKLDASFNDNIYLTLTDHISFAIIRYEQGIEMKNALLWEIKKLYKKEYNVALEALELIEKETGVRLPEDEAGSIAMHFINAQQGGRGMEQTTTMTKIINNILNIVKYHYGIDLDEDSLNYNRFLTHLRYLAYRLLNRELISEEENSWYDQVKTKYVEAFECAEKVKLYLEKSYDTKITKDEMVYFMIHIHRVTGREQK